MNDKKINNRTFTPTKAYADEPVADSLGCYTIYDKVAEKAAPPFYCVNIGVARRQFARILMQVPDYDKDSYQLLYLGDFDERKCVYEVRGPIDVTEDYNLQEEKISE